MVNIYIKLWFSGEFTANGCY